MDEHDALTERLRQLGAQPIDPALQSAHLTAMAPARPRRSWSKLRVAAAFLAGLLVGGSGLAVAGALPDPAQSAAHAVFRQVGVKVPKPDRHHGPECPGEAKANHGAYVRADKTLAKGDCGKPVHAVGRGTAGDDAGGPAVRGARGPCQGRPSWAGAKMSPEDKAAAQAERSARCGADEDAPAAEATPIDPTTTTTQPPPTTTTTPPTSTTTVAPTTTTAGATTTTG